MMWNVVEDMLVKKKPEPEPASAEPDNAVTPEPATEPKPWYQTYSHAQVEMPANQSNTDLINALRDSRANLNALKESYTDACNEKEPDAKKIELYCQEMARTVQAIERMKAYLAGYGVKFDINTLDYEEPAAARKRIEEVRKPPKKSFFQSIFS